MTRNPIITASPRNRHRRSDDRAWRIALAVALACLAFVAGLKVGERQGRDSQIETMKPNTNEN